MVNLNAVLNVKRNKNQHLVDAQDPSAVLMSTDNTGFVHTLINKAKQEGKLTMNTKKEKPRTKDETFFLTNEEAYNRQEYRSRQKDILRPKLKPPALADSPLVKAAEDWLLAHGLDAPYKSGQTIRLDLVFNLIDSGECELSFRISREVLREL